MALTRVFTVEGSSVSNGNQDELTAQDNDPWVIEKILVRDEEGNLGSTSDVTIQVGGNSITDQAVPLDVMATDIDSAPTWMAYWPANKTLRFSYTNEAGDSITLDFVVFVRSGDGVPKDRPSGAILESMMEG
jgi:hypothetical protein